MEGIITAVSATSVTATMDNSVGSGTYTSWNIGIAGDKGTAGEVAGSIVTEDTSASLTITIQQHANLDYDLNFQLDGDKCFVTGDITNNSGSTYGATNVCAFSNTAYNARTSMPTQFFAVKDDASFSNVLLEFNGNNLTLLGDIETTKKVTVNAFYYVN
jgi:hypothetical protein